jgi:predicted nucleic acid-binding Zn ribbon protein
MVDQHKHCPVCGTPIPMSERFCSPKCQQKLYERQRKVAKTRRIIYLAFAAIIIIYFLFVVLRGKLF